MRHLRRFWPLALLLLAAALAWVSGLGHLTSWETLARHQATLTAWVEARPLSAALAYVVIYAASTTLALPEAAVLTVAGGLLFGTLWGGALAVGGSSMGAVGLFLGVRHHLADAVARRGSKLLANVRCGLEHDGFSYLLAARLIPLFPFWLVNLAAGLSGMRLLPYATATVIGIIPATFIYASIGAGVGEVLALGGRPDLGIIFSPRILGPLAGLAILSLLPVAWRRWRRSDA